MAHVGYEYEEIQGRPKRLRAHCTPAVESPFDWLETEEDDR